MITGKQSSTERPVVHLGRAAAPARFTACLLLSIPTTLLAAQPRELSPAASNARSPHLFERIVAIRELSDGRLLISDQGANQVLAYTFGSGPPRTASRLGDGPGEFRTAGRLYPLEHDQTLFVDGYSWRWLIFDGTSLVATVAEHEPQVRSLGGLLSGVDRRGQLLAVKGSHFAAGVVRRRETADSLVVISGARTRADVDTLFVIRGRGSDGYELSRDSPRIIMANPLAAEDQVLLFPDGWIAVARVAPYRVDWRSPAGAWVRGQPLPENRFPVNDRVKCQASRELLGNAVPCPPVTLRGWPEFLPPFRPTSFRQPLPPLLATPDGQLVIARSRIGMEAEGHYDIINRSGRLSGTLRVPPHTAIAMFGNATVYLVLTDEDDLQAIHRLRWP